MTRVVHVYAIRPKLLRFLRLSTRRPYCTHHHCAREALQCSLHTLQAEFNPLLGGRLHVPFSDAAVQMTPYTLLFAFVVHDVGPQRQSAVRRVDDQLPTANMASSAPG